LILPVGDIDNIGK